ncbi:hypothetical protein JW756_01810 [Candidatus Woesearchaeota archaeon]|nr:hypothetical protein [Candidatus Woesearchaeota archaeon]
MNPKAKTFVLLLSAILFLGLFTQFASAFSNYNYPYYPRYNYAYNTHNNYYNHYTHYSNYNYPYGWALAPMPSYNCNAIYGCRTTYNSYIHLGNALDYTYYTHPELLAPRYMSNHMRYARGLWPERFWY